MIFKVNQNNIEKVINKTKEKLEKIPQKTEMKLNKIKIKPLQSHLHCKICKREMEYLTRMSFEIDGVSDLYYCSHCILFARDYEHGTIKYFSENK